MKLKEYLKARDKRENESFEDYLKEMSQQMERNDKIFEHNCKLIDFRFYCMTTLVIILTLVAIFIL
jgi:hypothetical protein